MCYARQTCHPVRSQPSLGRSSWPMPMVPRLDVLHVLEAAADATALLKPRRDDLTIHLRQMVEGLLDRQLSVNTSVAHGVPSGEILLYSRKHMSDLIIVGSCSSHRQRSFVLLGHTTRAVITGAACPVLVVPEAKVTASGKRDGTLISLRISRRETKRSVAQQRACIG